MQFSSQYVVFTRHKFTTLICLHVKSFIEKNLNISISDSFDDKVAAGSRKITKKKISATIWRQLSLQTTISRWDWQRMTAFKPPPSGNSDGIKAHTHIQTKLWQKKNVEPPEGECVSSPDCSANHTAFLMNLGCCRVAEVWWCTGARGSAGRCDFARRANSPKDWWKVSKKCPSKTKDECLIT